MRAVRWRLRDRVAEGMVAAIALVLVTTAAAQAEPLALRGVRGATTVEANTPEAIRAAMGELMQGLIAANRLQPERIVSLVVSATADVNAIFPASVPRRLPGWQDVALLDVQQMAVPGDLPRCLRVLITTWLPQSQRVQHLYLGEAQRLRPDRPAPAPGQN